MEQRVSTQKLAVLDGMRGVAAILIMMRHTGEMWGFKFFHSYLAVDLFFVLSGFVIAHAYEEKLLQGTLSAKQFTLIRLIRFYPMYFVSLLLCVLLLYLQHAPGNGVAPIAAASMNLSFLSSLFFVPSMLGAFHVLFPLNPPSWSLMFELLVNFSYVSTRRQLTNTALHWVVVISGAVMVILSARRGDLDDGYGWGIGSFALGLGRSTFGIAVGLLLHRTFLAGRIRALRWERHSHLLPVGIVTAFLAAPNMGAFNWLFDLSAAFVAFPLCVYWGAHALPEHWTNGPYAVLGMSSYPIYVLHFPIGGLVGYVWGDYVSSHAPLTGILFLTFLFVAAYLLEQSYDLPLRRHLARRLVWSQRSLATR